MSTAFGKDSGNGTGNGKLGYGGSKSFQLPALNIPSDSLTAGTNIPPPPPSPPPPAASEKSVRAPRPHDLNTGIAGDPPHTPDASDSPNPLRSHPTSSHSLHQSTSGPDGTPASQASVANQKRMHSSPNTPTDSSPPPKRPMSVRKLLSLRALNSAFNRDAQSESPASNKSGNKVYANGNKSSDNLSMFSFARPSTSMSSGRPQLKKKRSSAFWGRRSTSFFGNSVQEEVEDEGGNGAVTTPEVKKEPPPTLPALDRLGAGRGLKEGNGGFLGGGDMFRDIK